jgi:alkanesulfonate monooxygenase SsuD/methylene tetrahydromethanopterin reductase-like flavin-dependent oxidoreductase (luciferase family)
MAMRPGVFLPQDENFPPRSVVDAARRAEDIGYDSVWVFERVRPSPVGITVRW